MDETFKRRGTVLAGSYKDRLLQGEPDESHFGAPAELQAGVQQCGGDGNFVGHGRQTTQRQTLTVPRYSSLRTSRLTQNVHDEISRKEKELAVATQSQNDRLIQVEDSLRQVKLLESTRHDEDEEDMQGAEAQLEQQAEALKAAHILLPELLSQLSSGRFEGCGKPGRTNNVSFGDQNSGLQIGVNDGGISGVTIGQRSQ